MTASRRHRLLAACLLAGCSFLDPKGVGTNGEDIIAMGRERHYEWAAPGGDAARPVLLAFHGLGGDARGMRDMTNLAEDGTKAGFVVVFPEADVAAERGWSVGCEKCTNGDVLGIDDVAYVDRLLDHLETRTKIDRSRIYATGFSMGGWFTYTLACLRSSTVKGIVAVGGLMPRPVAAACTPQSPVSALVVFGDQDQTQPYNGKPDPFGLLGVDSTAVFWANAAQCSSGPAEYNENHGSVVVGVVARDSCAGGARVRRHRVTGLAHTWPTGSYNATYQVILFFGGVYNE